MFEQHPVPQQISSYHFRLVGNMTIRQFFQVAAGAIVALIIYGLPLPPYIKWPLVIFAALGGAAFAFLPIQDRPLEKWLAAFFKSIYSPTIFTWQYQEVLPQYFKTDPGSGPGMTSGTQPASASDGQTFHEDAKDLVEENKVSKGVVPTFISGEQPVEEVVANPTSPTAMVEPQQTVDINMQAQVDDSLGAKIIREQQMEGREIVKDTGPKRQEVIVPKTGVVDVKNEGYEGDDVKVDSPHQEITTSKVGEVLHNEQQVQTSQAQFSPDAAPPITPEQSNIVVGQVMDSAGHIVDGAILEIKNEQGSPVRAFKTNKAGHFAIVTQIPDGDYTLLTEKDGYQFIPLSLKAKGEIIAPIAVKAQNTLNN